MDWYTPVVEKWIVELATERRLPEHAMHCTVDLLTRLHRIMTQHRLEITIPSVENEILPIAESPNECTLALTWVAPGGRTFQLMYVPKLDKTRLKLMMAEEDIRITDDPADQDIVDALLSLGVPQLPEEPTVIVDDHA